jgi:hypothetical protein
VTGLTDNPTGRKLTWLTAIRFDRRVTDFEYRVVSAIADHLSRKTGLAYVSDGIVAIETGCRTERSVRRARSNLRQYGYLSWQHTEDANVYGIEFAKVLDTLDTMKALKAEHRKKITRRQDSSVLTTRTEESAIPVSIPLKTESTEKRRSLSKRGLSVGDRQLPLVTVVASNGRR